MLMSVYTTDRNTRKGQTMSNSGMQDNTAEKPDDTDLFDSNLLENVSNKLHSDGFIFRPLNSRDFDKGFLKLLEQLTKVGNISQIQFLNRFYDMKKTGAYYIVVIEDLNCKQVIASATLVIEQKFIHNCGLHGFLEDVVVNNEYRGKQLGKLIVTAVKQIAKSLGCYKLTLNCKDHLTLFYESLGFKREPGNANSMHIRFLDKPAEQL